MWSIIVLVSVVLNGTVVDSADVLTTCLVVQSELYINAIEL